VSIQTNCSHDEERSRRYQGTSAIGAAQPPQAAIARGSFVAFGHEQRHERHGHAAQATTAATRATARSGPPRERRRARHALKFARVVRPDPHGQPPADDETEPARDIAGNPRGERCDRADGAERSAGSAADECETAYGPVALVLGDPRPQMDAEIRSGVRPTMASTGAGNRPNKSGRCTTNATPHPAAQMVQGSNRIH